MLYKNMVVASLVASFIQFGCMNDNSLDPGSSLIQDNTLTVSVALPASEQDSISKAEVIISGKDMDTVNAALSIEKNRIFGTVSNIPLGYNRHIEIKVYNKAGLVTYYGEGYADVLSDKTVNVTIKIRCLKGSIAVNGIITNPPPSAFGMDDETIFLANFNYNIKNLVTGKPGTRVSTVFRKGLYGSGIAFSDTGANKSICRFPNSEKLSLKTGTMEAIVYAKSASTDYMHIIDKSWLYGITAFGGNLAVNFGSGWWYTSIALPLNKWTYVAGSYDGTTISLYVNGECVASGSYSGYNGDESYDLGIGNGAADTHDVPFLGTIDEVRISKSVRTAKEIALNWMEMEKQFSLQ